MKNHYWQKLLFPHGNKTEEKVAHDIFNPRTHYRREDPQTSREAAESVAETFTIVQARVLEIHREFDGLTDEELTNEYVQRFGVMGQSSIRSRRNDLTLKGHFTDSGVRRRVKTGRLAIVWKLT
jgi:hypothetical protein